MSIHGAGPHAECEDRTADIAISRPAIVGRVSLYCAPSCTTCRTCEPPKRGTCNEKVIAIASLRCNHYVAHARRVSAIRHSRARCSTWPSLVDGEMVEWGAHVSCRDAPRNARRSEV